MKIPYKLILFVLVAGFFYLVILPKRNQFVKALLEGRSLPNREDSVKAMVKARILTDICSPADLCEYRPASWSDFSVQDASTASIRHKFTTDGSNREFLFRLRYGTVAEIHNMR